MFYLTDIKNLCFVCVLKQVFRFAIIIDAKVLLFATKQTFQKKVIKEKKILSN